MFGTNSSAPDKTDGEPSLEQRQLLRAMGVAPPSTSADLTNDNNPAAGQQAAAGSITSLRSSVSNSANMTRQLTTDGQQTKRTNLMRYSTPNLLLSTNFEHILRQCDKVSVWGRPAFIICAWQV